MFDIICPWKKKKVKVKSLSRARLFVTPWTVACTKLLCPWDFLGKNTGVGCCFLLQEIFPTQGSNPGLPHCRQTLYCLSHQGSLVLRNMQIKSTVRYWFTSTRMTMIPRQIITSVDKYVEKMELSYIAVGDVKWCNHFGKTVWQFLKKLTVNLSRDSAILFLGIYPRELKAYIYTKIRTQMFTTILLKTKNENHQNFYQPMNEQTKCHLSIQWGITQSNKEMKYWFMLQHEWTLTHCAKWKKPDTEGHILFDFAYIKCPEKANP